MYMADMQGWTISLNGYLNKLESSLSTSGPINDSVVKVKNIARGEISCIT